MSFLKFWTLKVSEPALRLALRARFCAMRSHFSAFLTHLNSTHITSLCFQLIFFPSWSFGRLTLRAQFCALLRARTFLHFKDNLIIQVLRLNVFDCILCSFLEFWTNPHQNPRFMLIFARYARTLCAKRLQLFLLPSTDDYFSYDLRFVCLCCRLLRFAL